MSKLYREYGFSLFLLAASGLLAVVLLLEWAHFRGEEADLERRLATKVEVNVEAPQREEEETSGLPDLEEFSEMINRPLFVEARRPPEVGEGSAQERMVQTPLTLKLMGVVFTPKDRTALLVDAKGKYKRARKNTVVDGWTLVEIEQDKVTLAQGEEQQELKLLKPKPKTAAPARTGQAAVKIPNKGNAEEGTAPEEAPADESGGDEVVPEEPAPGESGGDEVPPDESESTDQSEYSADENLPSDEQQ
jgi:hypothetical protein